MSRSGWRTLSHTADVGLEVWAPALGDLYATAAPALFGVMGKPATFAPSEPFEHESAGIDREDLLVRLLTDLLARFEVEGRFVTSARCVSLRQDPGDWRVTLRCEGGTVERDGERGLVEVKAVTYHRLDVRDEAGGVRARVYLDL